MARWDLLGKHLQTPVWQLLGGRKASRMPAYASGGWADAQGIGTQLKGYVESGGFKAVKMRVGVIDGDPIHSAERRSEEHTSELQSLMRISYAVFCLKKKNR